MEGKKFGLISLDGAMAGIMGYNALENLLTYVNTKAAILQVELAKNPELTEQVYQTAEKVAEKISSGDLYMGIIQAGLSGIFAGLAVYWSCRKD